MPSKTLKPWPSGSPVRVVSSILRPWMPLPSNSSNPTGEVLWRQPRKAGAQHPSSWQTCDACSWSPASPSRLAIRPNGALGDGLSFSRWSPEDSTPLEANEAYGELDGHSFYLSGDDFSVAIGDRGWEITVDHAPVSKPIVTVMDRHRKTLPIHNEAFRARATQLLEIRARRMHAEVASAWPRRSTMPDRTGKVQHPLGGLAAKWHCLHCDGVHDGRTIAQNLWHCPTCAAAPIDIFMDPFWNGAKRSA